MVPRKIAWEVLVWNLGRPVFSRCFFPPFFGKPWKSWNLRPCWEQIRFYTFVEFCFGFRSCICFAFFLNLQVSWSNTTHWTRVAKLNTRLIHFIGFATLKPGSSRYDAFCWCFSWVNVSRFLGSKEFGVWFTKVRSVTEMISIYSTYLFPEVVKIHENTCPWSRVNKSPQLLSTGFSTSRIFLLSMKNI